MNKQEFFAFGATCGLQVMCDGHNVGKINRFYTEYDSVGILFTNYTFDYGLSDIKSIVRPLSDLTKECIQADYSDGNPFVPIVELAKMCDVNLKIESPFIVNNEYFVYGCNAGDNLFWYNKKGSFNFSILTEKKEHILNINNQFKLLQLLLKWHFWPDMPEGENVIYVSESFNPYK